MIEVADVFRQFGEAYLAAFGNSMLPSHERAIRDIIRCRTEAMGGNLYQCDTCHHPVFAYHSCKNRSCPKCHTEQTQRWLALRKEEMLPIPYFHVVITIPESLRSLFRSNQKALYNIFMKSCAEAILELAKDPKHVGGLVGILMVLHTWTAQLLYHPHLHCLVPGGGITPDGVWHPAKDDFLFPTPALSILVRGKVMTAIKKQHPDMDLPKSAWEQQWVTDCFPWGEGNQAVLEYLARYVFRIAITNARIVAMDESTVTFKYKDRKQNKWGQCQVSGEEFIRRFLQHVLPEGFHKVRYYGLLHPNNRHLIQQIRLLCLLASPPVQNKPPPVDQSESSLVGQSDQETIIPKSGVGAACPCCETGRLILVRRIPRPLAGSP